jgi:hypothetical protein
MLNVYNFGNETCRFVYDGGIPGRRANQQQTILPGFGQIVKPGWGRIVRHAKQIVF